MWTYREREAQSNQLARYLRTRGVRPASLVALAIDRSLELVVGMLAILKAGGAYVPVDPSYRSERRQFMLEDSEAAVILTGAPLIQSSSIASKIGRAHV